MRNEEDSLLAEVADLKKEVEVLRARFDRILGAILDRSAVISRLAAIEDRLEKMEEQRK